MILLPAIDIRGGKAVRLQRGDFSKETVYQDDPLEAAASFVAAGAPTCSNAFSTERRLPMP